MSRKEILEKITEVFKDVMDDETLELKEETTNEDLEDWDSLAHISIMMELMKSFQIKFEMDEIGKMNSVGKIIDIIEEKMI